MMSNTEYSPYKIVHWPGHIRMLRNNEQPVPLQVQVVPSNTCNQRCGFCAYRQDGGLSNQRFSEREMLDTKKIIECLDCFAEMGIRAVHYTGGGEPLVHPDITDIFRATIDRGLDFALVSNGMALTDAHIDLLTRAAAWVRISIDAAVADTYATLRNTGSNVLAVVNNNIDKLVRRKQKQKQEMALGVGFVVCRENYREVYEAAKIYRDKGVENFRISAAFHPDGYAHFESFIDEAEHLCAAAESLSTDSFRVFNLFNNRVRDIYQGTQDYDKCRIINLLTYIGADYNVYTCCTLAYNNLGLIGSIKNQSFRALWTGSKKQRMFSRHSPRRICNHPCMYKSKNEFINYCVSKNAKHVAFI